MKISRTFLTGFLVMAGAVAGWAQSAGEKTDSLMLFRHKGTVREYVLYVPDSLAEGKPLVIMLHGYTAKANPDRFGLREAAKKHGFALCCPQGAKDARGKTCWNVGYPFQEGLATDDVDFICKLSRHVARKHNLSRRNIFCAGHSNGGEMCYLLAWLKPEKFNAIAPLAGLTLEWIREEYDAKKGVPLMEIHGTADKTSLWEGDPENAGGWGSYIGVEDAVLYWAKVNGCTQEQTDTIPNKSGKTVIAHRHCGSPSGNEVWLYEIRGGGHSWSEDDLDTGTELWNFFSKYIR